MGHLTFVLFLYLCNFVGISYIFFSFFISLSLSLSLSQQIEPNTTNRFSDNNKVLKTPAKKSYRPGWTYLPSLTRHHLTHSRDNIPTTRTPRPTPTTPSPTPRPTLHTAFLSTQRGMAWSVVENEIKYCTLPSLQHLAQKSCGSYQYVLLSTTRSGQSLLHSFN